MEFSILADSFNKMESTTKRLELTQYLVELFEKTPQRSNLKDNSLSATRKTKTRF